MRTSRAGRRCRSALLAVAIWRASGADLDGTILAGDEGFVAIDAPVWSSPTETRPAGATADRRGPVSKPVPRRPDPERRSRSSLLRDLFVGRVWHVQEPREVPRATQTAPIVENTAPPAIFQPATPGQPEVTGVRLPMPGPTTPASKTMVPQPPAPTPLLLNQALQLQDSPVPIYGWIENSANIDTKGMPRNRTDFSIFPDHLSNQ